MSCWAVAVLLALVHSVGTMVLTRSMNDSSATDRTVLDSCSLGNKTAAATVAAEEASI